MHFKASFTVKTHTDKNRVFLFSAVLRTSQKPVFFIFITWVKNPVFHECLFAVYTFLQNVKQFSKSFRTIWKIVLQKSVNCFPAFLKDADF